MIYFTKTEQGGMILFDESDVETMRTLFNRALNTWQPNPPEVLLEIQRHLNEQDLPELPR
jgi:hypothetical protein